MMQHVHPVLRVRQLQQQVAEALAQDVSMPKSEDLERVASDQCRLLHAKADAAICKGPNVPKGLDNVKPKQL